MPCGPLCACEPGVECLSVVDPGRFGYFRAWCESGDEAKRRHVRLRSRLGIVAPTELPSPSVSPPGLLTQAATFAKAIVTHAIAGLPEADEATFAARMATCEACPDVRPGPTCNRCGCGLVVKARWAEQRCPIGKW